MRRGLDFSQPPEGLADVLVLVFLCCDISPHFYTWSMLNNIQTDVFFSPVSEQTQDSMYKFEQRAGLTDASYTPHKGLTAEETRHHHRIPESLHVRHTENHAVRTQDAAANYNLKGSMCSL